MIYALTSMLALAYTLSGGVAPAVAPRAAALSMAQALHEYSVADVEALDDAGLSDLSSQLIPAVYATAPDATNKDLLRRTLATVYAKQGKYNMAEPMCVEVLKNAEFKDDVNMHCIIARAMEARSVPAQTALFYERALAYDPDCQEAKDYLAATKGKDLALLDVQGAAPAPAEGAATAVLRASAELYKMSPAEGIAYLKAERAALVAAGVSEADIDGSIDVMEKAPEAAAAAPAAPAAAARCCTSSASPRGGR